MSERFPELIHLSSLPLPKLLQARLRADSLQDLIIWQTAGENQRWDNPFDAGCELLESDPETCFATCKVALAEADAALPLISAVLKATTIENFPVIPAYFENLNARLLVAERPDFLWGKPYVQVPDICVRGRLWLANELSLGSFPFVEDSVAQATQLTDEALCLAPTDVDSLGLKTALEYLKYSNGFPYYYRWLRLMFRHALTVEQKAYAYYIAALVESGTPRALGCYQQMTPGTEFYENALTEASDLRATLNLSLKTYSVPDYTDPAEIFFENQQYLLAECAENNTHPTREEESTYIQGGQALLTEIKQCFTQSQLAAELKELYFFEATHAE